MKKRLFALLLCFFLALTMLPVPVQAAGTPLKITKQPKNCYVGIGKKASVSVSAQGDGLKYQWYYRNAEGTKYYKSSVTSSTYSAAMTEARNGRRLYCVITDRYGNSVTSKTVMFKIPTELKITRQPKNCYVESGEKFSVSVSAQGDGLKYQWYYKNKGSSTFSKSSVTLPTYSAAMTAARNGRKVYCVITDRYGNSVTSKTVTLKIPTALKITQQPKSTSVAFNKRVSVSVAAEGDGLKYQWYYRNLNSSTYRKASSTTSTYSAPMTESRVGRRVYCVITDRYGNSVRTNTVKLSARIKFEQDLYKMKPKTAKSLLEELDFTPTGTLKWTSSDTSIAKVNSKGKVTGVKNGTVTITVTETKTGIQGKCKVKVCNLKQVALTFDDGPSKHTERLLDFLEDHEEVKVTFFMVGNRLTSFKDSVKRVAEQGHEIGYHSYSHAIQTGLSSAKILSDYEKSEKTLKSLTGKEFTVWRTPGGGYSTRVLDSLPLPHIMWSVDTRDWETRNSTSVYYAITNRSKDGSIVLLHDLHGTTVDGSIRAIEKMLEGDYEFVTVTELLSRDGKAPKPSTNYFSG